MTSQLHKIDEQSTESHLESVEKNCPVPTVKSVAKQDVSMEASQEQQSTALPLVTNEG